MSRGVVFRRVRIAGADDKEMVQRWEVLDLYVRRALEAVLPVPDVLVDHLVIAAAMQNEDRNAEASRDCDLVARVEVIEVRRGCAHECSRRWHLMRRDFFGLALGLDQS